MSLAVKTVVDAWRPSEARVGHIKLVTEIPGPKSREVLANHERYVPRALALGFPAAIREANGALLTDVDGNRFVDLAGGWAGGLGGGFPAARRRRSSTRGRRRWRTPSRCPVCTRDARR